MGFGLYRIPFLVYNCNAMKKYIFTRFLRSLFSIMAVLTIAFTMVYALVPRERVFQGDPLIQKLTSKPDQLLLYKNITLERLGYIDFTEQKDMCKGSSDYSACMVPNSEVANEWLTTHAEDGWTKGQYSVSGLIYGIREIGIVEHLFVFYSNMIHIDSPNKVEDPSNPSLERGISFGTDPNGLPAIKCSGCEHNYLLYLDGQFPFIHQNLITFDLGKAYPSFAYIPVLEVISEKQGGYDYKDVNFETGSVQSSPIDIHQCTYKPTESLDRLDGMKFNDNYANCQLNATDPSMLTISFIIGIFALIFSYFIGIPAGILMAENKGGWIDRVGLVIVTIMFSIPSLAFIYFVRYGNVWIFSLPDKFPTFGSLNPLSYISPIIILGALSLSSMIIWVRRYMIDQSTSDYVKFAKAKGLSKREIFIKHILRNAIIPIAQGLPAGIIATLGGAVMTETVFAAPGMGKMLPDAVLNYNNPLIIALTFIFTTLSIFSVFAGDILITYIDPRISLAEKKGE